MKWKSCIRALFFVSVPAVLCADVEIVTVNELTFNDSAPRSFPILNDSSAISFNVTFGSWMVLQRAPAKACVYGTVTNVSSTVVVSVDSINEDGEVASSYEVSAASSGGLWKACLHPTKAGGNVTITATAGAFSASIDNVVLETYSTAADNQIWRFPSSIRLLGMRVVMLF